MKFISFHLLLHLNSFRSPPPDKYTDRYTSPLPLPRQASLYATTLSWQTEANKRTFGKATVQRAAPVTLSGVLSHRGKVFGIKAMELWWRYLALNPPTSLRAFCFSSKKRCVVFDGKTWQKAGEHFFRTWATISNKLWKQILTLRQFRCEWTLHQHDSNQRTKWTRIKMNQHTNCWKNTETLMKAHKSS